MGVQRHLSIVLDLRLYEVDVARLLTSRGGIHEDGEFVIVLQGVGEIHPPNTKVLYLNALRQLAPGEPLHHLDPETIIAQKYVADAGNENALTHREPRSPAARSPRERKRTGARESGPLPGRGPGRPPGSPRYGSGPRSLALCPRRTRPFP